MATEQELLAQLEALEQDEAQVRPVAAATQPEQQVDAIPEPSSEEELLSQLETLEEEEGYTVGNDAEQYDAPPSSTDEAAITQVDESPEDFYLRTNKVPAGYKVVPTVPTADTGPGSLSFKLELIDAPAALTFDERSEQQVAETFDYDKTRAIASALYGDDPDILVTQDFLDEKVAPELHGVMKVLGNVGDEIIKPLAVGMTAASETAQDTGANLTRWLHTTFTEDNKIFGMTGKEIMPFEPEVAGEKFGGDLAMMLEMAEAVPAVGSLTGLAGRAGQRAVEKPFREATKAVKAREAAEATRERVFAQKMRINKAKEATAEEMAAKRAAAEAARKANQDIADELIDAFEKETGKEIHSVVDGVKVLDGAKARQAGLDTAEEIAEANSGTVREFLRGESSQTDAAMLAGQGDQIVRPVLKQEKFDGLVAAAAELKDRFPDAFNNDRPLIDNLFELTVNKQLLAGDELIDMLNKYGVSFEDYILTVVSGGSEAGKTLNKLSQIKRVRPANEMIAMQEAATKESANSLRKGIMRIENIRRGGLVSQVATAARNLQSGAIRAPLEGLGNVMDNSLYRLSNEGVTAGAREFVRFGNWRESFRHMKYMFSPEGYSNTKDYVDFILDQPELAKQYDLLFNNINEIQKLTGRGEGGAIDATLSVVEDAVDVLNTPNRWQEHLIRRGAFLGELERLAKREYDIDLIDTINDGKIRDLLNDASTVRPKGARSFNELVADATNKALDITYAKQPDIPVFRSTSQFIVRNGLTVVMPFPRFMFNSMELMGQYAGGASIPLARKMLGVVKPSMRGPLTAKDRQRISRNILGIAVAGAAYQYRTSEEAPSDYKLLKTGADTVMDVTPQYPMRQFMYIGEALKRAVDGTFDDWFKAREFTETFVGTNIREGVGQSLIQEVADLASGVDLTDEEQAGRLLGSALGNYLSTWAVPFAQIIEAERAAGVRGLEYKDTAEDPTLDFQTSFMQNLQRPFARFQSAEDEAALPKREFLFTEEKSRVAPLFRVLGGINLATIDDEYGEYVSSFGYTDYELGSRSKVPSIRRFENRVVRDAMPEIVESAKLYEESLREQYREASDVTREEFTEEKYVSSRVRAYIKKQVSGIRKQLSDDKVLAADAPAFAEAMLTYRRLPKDVRKSAGIKFVEMYDRHPDVGNPEPIEKGSDTTKGQRDLMLLTEIAQAYNRVLN
jgi:hypothetical protein